VRRAIVAACTVAWSAACHQARPTTAAPAESFDPPQRGDAAAARAVAPDDRLNIYAAIVRDFFRPFGGQARWIDPRPLGDVRDARADRVAAPDIEWAESLREAIAHDRVCVLGLDEDGCRGRRGSLLRFSPPYAEDAERAHVFARVIPGFEDTPAAKPDAGTFEMEFTMERRGQGWRIAGKRTVRTHRPR
jgi:hypothetical protein